MAIQDDINLAVAQVATDYGEEYVKQIRAALSKADKLATGALYNSINYDVSINGNTVALQVLYNIYLEWINSGRKPGKMPPVDSILNWIIARRIQPPANARRNILGRFSKGFSIKQGRNGKGQYTSIKDQARSLAWAIAVSIKKKGIKAVPILDDVNSKLYAPMQMAATEAAAIVAEDGLGQEFADFIRQQGLLITTQ